MDLRKEAVGIIRENLSLTGFSDRATVVQGDYLAFLTRCRETFDVIFLDPPYGSGMLEKALETITTIDIVSENGIIVCENGSTVGWPAVRAPYRLQKEYRYGKSEPPCTGAKPIESRPQGGRRKGQHAMKTAIYPGSFDRSPWDTSTSSNGRRWLDKVIVCVMVNSEKNGGLFTPEERMT